jgi:hypothetical protein
MEMASRNGQPFDQLLNIAEVTLPAILNRAAQPRLIAGSRGTPDAPYVDAQWPADESRILQRYRFLVQLANALHPSATITPGSIRAALDLVDPVTLTPIIDRRAQIDAIRAASDRFDMDTARALLTQGMLDYARSIESDADEALARLDRRFNEADPSRSGRAPLISGGGSAVGASAGPAEGQPLGQGRRLPAALGRAMTSILGRRSLTQRAAPVPAVQGAATPLAVAAAAPALALPRPAWSTVLQRQRRPISEPQPPLQGTSLPDLSARTSPLQGQQQPQREGDEEEEEEEEPIIKRQRRAPARSPLATEAREFLPEGNASPQRVWPVAQGDDIASTTLLGNINREQRRPGAVVGSWNLAAALDASRRQTERSGEYADLPLPTSPRGSGSTKERDDEEDEGEQDEELIGQEEREYSGAPWTTDRYIQVAAPNVFQRDVDIDTIRREERRARAQAEAIRQGYAARVDVDGNDLDAAVERADYLGGLVAYLEEEASSRPNRRALREEPFDAAYWYRVISMGGSGPLGPPTLLAAARGVHGPFATPQDASNDASIAGFDADEAIMDAVLAWTLSSIDALEQTGRNTALFQVQRPSDDAADSALPPTIAARVDPGVERSLVAIAATRTDAAPPQEGALKVLAWDRAVGGRARRVGVRDVFCARDGRPCAVVVAYETSDPQEAHALEQVLTTAGPPRDMAAAFDEISAAARAFYPGAVVDVAPNADGSALAVTVRLPVALDTADSDGLLRLAHATYGVVGATGASVDARVSQVVGADGARRPLPLPSLIVAAS